MMLAGDGANHAAALRIAGIDIGPAHKIGITNMRGATNHAPVGPRRTVLTAARSRHLDAVAVAGTAGPQSPETSEMHARLGRAAGHHLPAVEALTTGAGMPHTGTTGGPGGEGLRLGMAMLTGIEAGIAQAKMCTGGACHPRHGVGEAGAQRAAKCESAQRHGQTLSVEATDGCAIAVLHESAVLCEHPLQWTVQSRTAHQRRARLARQALMTPALPTLRRIQKSRPSVTGASLPTT